MDAELKLHRAAAEWFVNLREEPDDEALREAFEIWRASDPEHARAYRSVEETFAEFGDEPVQEAPTAPPLPVSRPGTASGRRSAAARPRRRAARAVVAAAAAACLAVLVIPAINLRLTADHLTATGVTQRLTLDDGSTVRLGPDSAIAVDLSADARTVRLLSGQAWFEVTQDASRPFRVRAGDVTTTVLGTGFDVRRLGELTAVSVAHGKVNVTDDGVSPTFSRDLVAGEWLRIGGDHHANSGITNPKLLGAWADGRIVANGISVREVIDEMRPWYSGKIILASAALGDRKVSGIYDPRKPDEALAALVSPDGGTIRRITPWLLIIN